MGSGTGQLADRHEVRGEGKEETEDASQVSDLRSHVHGITFTAIGNLSEHRFTEGNLDSWFHLAQSDTPMGHVDEMSSTKLDIQLKVTRPFEAGNATAESLHRTGEEHPGTRCRQSRGPRPEP